jgi:hypothetical protein
MIGSALDDKSVACSTVRIVTIRAEELFHIFTKISDRPSKSNEGRPSALMAPGSKRRDFQAKALCRLSLCERFLSCWRSQRDFSVVGQHDGLQFIR